MTTIITPSEQWLKQVTAVVRQVLNEQQKVGGARLVRPNTYSAIVLVETTEQIPARSGSVLGSGGCYLMRVDETDTLTYEYYSGSSADPVVDTLYNPFTSAAIDDNTLIIAGREIISGKLIAISEDC